MHFLPCQNKGEIMIELTKEEALDLLRKVSRIEGFLESVRGGGAIKKDIEGVTDMVTDKINKTKG